MMQQVASAKAEVAAFAALSGAAEPTGSSLGFDQVLQQQRDALPVASTTKARSANSASSQPDNNKTQSVAPMGKSAAPKEKPDHSAESHESHESHQAPKPESDKAQLAQQTATQRPSATQSEDAKVLTNASSTEKDDQQLESDSDEQWLELVLSLQGQESDEELANLSGEELTNGLTAQELQTWLQSQDDKILALAQLIEAKPALKTWLSEADLGHDSSLQSWVKQALALNTNTVSQEPIAALDPQHQLLSTAKVGEELALLAQDIAKLLNNNRLNPTEIEQLKLALSESLEHNTPLSQEIKNLVQKKLEATALSSPPPQSGNQSNNAAVSDVAQRETRNSIVDIEVAKMPLTLQADKDSLQAMLDKINGADKNMSQAGAAITIESDITSTGQSAASKAAQNKVGVTEAELAAAKEVAQPMLANNPELKALANLSDDDAESVLSALAQKIAEWLRNESSKGETKSPLVSVAKLSTDGVMVYSDAGKDMLAALKTGLDEFKQQLAAGHEPGLDLKALVAQALEKNADPALAAKVTEGLDKTIRSLANSLTAINQLSDSGLPSQALSAINLDNQTTQAEQYKAMQLQQADNKLDKAINLNKPESHQQLADKVRWMVNTGNLVANIRLDPAELGSMHVKVSMTAESATVNFVVQSAQTRDALEAATPRLREMLAEKGIELGQSAVRQDAQNQQNNQEKSGQRANSQGQAVATEGGIDEGQVVTQQVARHNSANTIDYFV